MDSLGKRIEKDEAEMRRLRTRADALEREAAQCRRDASEIERLLDQARFAQRG